MIRNETIFQKSASYYPIKNHEKQEKRNVGLTVPDVNLTSPIF